jgi:GNAT superfamily N-acetyltransferase
MKQVASPVVRHATTDDAGLLAELGARTFFEAFAADNTPEDMAAYLAAAFGRDQQAAELTDSDSVFLIAEVDGVAAGYAKLHAGATPDEVTHDDPIELARLYVSHEWLGRGLAATLMQACIDEAKKKGHRTLWLGVWEHNARARAFYSKWSFREVGEHIFQLGADSQTDILMERQVEECSKSASR